MNQVVCACATLEKVIVEVCNSNMVMGTKEIVNIYYFICVGGPWPFFALSTNL